MALSGRLRPQEVVCGDGQNWIAASLVPGLPFKVPGRVNAGPDTMAVGGVVARTAANAAATQGNVGFQSHAAGTPNISERSIELFRETSPWVRLISVFLF